MKKARKSTLNRIFGLMKPYRARLFFSIILAVVIVGTTLYLPILIGQAVDKIIGPDNVDFGGLFAILASMAVVMIVTAGAQWLMTSINNTVAYKMVRDLRTEAFAHLQELPLSYLDSHASGDIISRVINDVDQFSEGILMGFAQFFTGILTIILTLVFMFRINAFVTLVVICVTPLGMFTAAFIAKKTFIHFKDQSERRGAMTSVVEEMIEGFSSVKAFTMEEEVCRSFEETDEKLRSASMKAVFYSSITNPSTRFVNGLVYAGAGVFGALSVIAGNLTVGGLTCFLSYASQYTRPFNEISGVVTELQNSIACAARIFELIDEKTEMPDEPDVSSLRNVSGNVSLSHVCFSYTPEKPLIRDINLDVKPGQRIALVGPTGCGKTTIINLLMRFYDEDSGSIKIDGTDIRNVKRESVRAAYGMVLQDTWLRRGTIRENIAMSDPEANEETIVNAAKEAHAHSFIMRLPNGYDTVIDEGGANLSAGQKQLLCIARVMMAKPSMLILDEATSSIDTRTELLVQQAFLKIMNGHTSFVVAHRLSTIRSADRILVMRDGQIIEQGTHDELMAKEGFYHRLYMSQYD